MKRCLSILLTLLLALSSASVVLAYGPDGPPDTPFRDIHSSDWFYADVVTAFNAGLINGKAPGEFAPNDLLTYAEAAKLAACMRQLHDGVSFTPQNDVGMWYEPYVTYCKNAGILWADYPWNQPATRAGYMEIFASALPDTALAPINEIADGAIPDLGALSEWTKNAVSKLYRAGIVQGTGDDHACQPYDSIRRCEVAAILTRMMDPAKRISFTMTAPEHRIETIGGVTYVDGILIANKTYSLPADYAPGGLTAECQTALDALMAGAARDGLSIYPISTYRSYEYQAGLYERYAARDGYAEADRYSARPGHSEHQTGLAIDVNSLDYDFAYTPEGIWLAAHCAEYGFILRYPEGKESVTGYRYEPWHIRYLGREIAEEVTASGLTLEEYLGITSVYAD